MKYFLFIIISLSFSLQTVAKSKLETDPAFIEFKEKIDSSWKIQIKRNYVYIERREPVLVMPETKAHLPHSDLETSKDKLARLKKYGMKMKPKLTYRFQKRWTINDSIKAELKKDSIQAKIDSLPKKYRIEHLLESDLNQEGGVIFTPRTKSDRRKVQKYFREKARLEKQIPPLPDYHLNKFSLFFISSKGIQNEYSDVYPESVIGEFIRIQTLLYKHKSK